MEGILGLVGVAIGSLLTILVNWFNRRWDRKDKRRETLLARAEELAAFATAFNELQMKVLTTALGGEVTPPPMSIFRIQMLATVYLPKAEPAAKALVRAYGQMQDKSHEVASFVRGHPGTLPPTELTAALRKTTEGLVVAGGALTEVICAIIRSELLPT